MRGTRLFLGLAKTNVIDLAPIWRALSRRRSVNSRFNCAAMVHLHSPLSPVVSARRPSFGGAPARARAARLIRLAALSVRRYVGSPMGPNDLLI